MDTAPLGPTRYFLNKVTLPRLVNVANTPPTCTQVQGVCQNEETKKYTLIKNSRNCTKENGDNLSGAEFKTSVVRLPNKHKGIVD